MPKYLAPIDMNKNEIQNAIFQKLATAPANPIKGQFYFNTTDNVLYVYNGTSWISAMSQGETNYNNLSNIPVTNAGSSTISTPGIYRTTTSNTTFSGIYKDVEHLGALVIYDGTHAIEIYGADAKYHGPTSSSEVIDIIDTLNDLGNNKVTKNNAITGATKAKITYDSKGLVTGGEDLSASDIPDLSATYIPQTAKGAVNGVAELDSSGLVPSSQLPSYVDDVIDLLAITDTAPSTCAKGDKYFNTTSNKIFTATAANTWGTTGKTPEAGVIYVNLDNNYTYRWSGSSMINISNPIDYASQSEAETGSNNTKVMTPLRVKQSIDHNIHTKAYNASIGDATSTSITVTHSLNTTNVLVNVFETASPYQQVFPDIKISSANTIVLEFSVAPTANQYKVMIVGLV